MTTASLTIMFTDIAGSTRLRSRVGERCAERLRRAHFAQLREALERHRGREMKKRCDGMMAVLAAARDAVECPVAIERVSVKSTAIAPDLLKPEETIR
jgi:class 3 adenylate cyclase